MTTRKLKAKVPKTVITPEAINIFRRMLSLEQQCACTARKECAACEQWWSLHRDLHRALLLRPWQFPAIEPPGAVNDCAPGTLAATWFPEAVKLYAALARAAEKAAA